MPSIARKKIKNDRVFILAYLPGTIYEEVERTGNNGTFLSRTVTQVYEDLTPGTNNYKSREFHNVPDRTIRTNDSLGIFGLALDDLGIEVPDVDLKKLANEQGWAAVGEYFDALVADKVFVVHQAEQPARRNAEPKRVIIPMKFLGNVSDWDMEVGVKYMHELRVELGLESEDDATAETTASASSNQTTLTNAQQEVLDTWVKEHADIIGDQKARRTAALGDDTLKTPENAVVRGIILAGTFNDYVTA